ncbi:MAG: hypothetical protein L7U72_06640, partial [Rubripirellula sp.]|nr:hypothetical protein [Rubripirellula sp.]
ARLRRRIDRRGHVKVAANSAFQPIRHDEFQSSKTFRRNILATDSILIPSSLRSPTTWLCAAPRQIGQRAKVACQTFTNI